MKTKPQPIKHFLVTIDLCPAPYRMHGYLMTNDRRDVEGITNKMCDAAEQEGFKVTLPIVLATILTDGVAVVRDVLARHSPEAKELFKTATDFHCSIFMLYENNPDDKILMDLH